MVLRRAEPLLVAAYCRSRRGGGGYWSRLTHLDLSQGLVLLCKVKKSCAGAVPLVPYVFGAVGTGPA